MLAWFKNVMLSATTKALELHAALIFMSLALWSHWVPSMKWYGMAIGFAFAAWKEFWFDPNYESAPIKWSGVTDFVGYCIGFAVISIYWLT